MYPKLPSILSGLCKKPNSIFPSPIFSMVLLSRAGMRAAVEQTLE